MLILSTLLAQADPIPGLFNTGVDDSENPLPDGGVDPHYSLILAPANSGLGPNAYAVLTNLPPISSGDWLPNSTTSKWIAPQANQSTFDESNNVDGTYVYQLKFNLTGYNPATATINGIWATDNPGEDILINGASTGITHADGTQGSSFQYFSSFTISSGFVSGMNTLDFIVYNTPFPTNSASAGGDNPSGLRVELSGTVEPVPEPSAWTMLPLGAGVLLASRWRRQNKP